jgi:sulfite dehydrogenase (cytochrome) subunit A
MHRDEPQLETIRRGLLDRRQFMRRSAGALALAAGGFDGLSQICRAAAVTTQPSEWPHFARFPQKTDLILNIDRPPNLEMPLERLVHDITPNDTFYVRWHLADIPTRVDLNRYRLTLGGHVDNALSLTLDNLRQDFEPVSVVAVNQCSGNSRSKFDPRMPGVQWGNGAIGNAKWTGVRLRDILAKAKIKAGAVDISFNGLDQPILQSGPGYAGTPDFVKALSFDHANDGEVLVAYAMNDQPLPMLNGFPARLIVPGWYATYWVKALSEITVCDKPFEGFWMAKAYRVPKTPGFIESPDALAKETVPINRMTVRSLFVPIDPNKPPIAGADYEVQGVALDGGSGIAKVEISIDDGKTWAEARLDSEIGKYSWRRFRYTWRPARGTQTLMARATNNAGDTQVEHQWNRSGYARNVIEKLQVTVA